MKMLAIIIRLIGTILVLFGIVLIYDARMLTKRFFSFGDQNEATSRFENFRIYHCNNWRINRIFCII